MFDIRQLQVLSEVARTGSYTAAARELGYTQPAVSYQMRQLERAARTPLVVHAGRGVRLTEAGRRLAATAGQVLAALRDAEAELATLAGGARGRVRLAAFQSGSATLVPALLDLLADTGIELVLHQVEPPEAAKLIAAGEVDLGLMCDWENEEVNPAERPLERFPLLTDRRCVLIPAGHPAAARSEVDFASLAGEAWVMETARERFTAACARAGFQPRIAATVDDQVAVQQLVAGGVGIALMNELALASHLDARLVARPLADWPRRRVYAAAWPDMARVPAVATVLDRLRQAAGRFRRRPPARAPHAGEPRSTSGPAPVPEQGLTPHRAPGVESTV